MSTTFHVSIGVASIEKSLNFFVGILKGTVLHKDPSGYVNIDLYGCKVTLKQNDGINPNFPDFHFGVNMELSAFDRLADSIAKSGYDQIVMSPKIVDEGTPIERKKMYLKCPTGYLVELKGYKHESDKRA